MATFDENPEHDAHTTWRQQILRVLSKNQVCLIAVAFFYATTSLVGYLDKYYLVGPLPEDNKLFEPTFSLGPVGDFLSGILFYTLFGLISLFTSVVHFGLLLFFANLRAHFSIGTNLATFQLHERNAAILLFAGYLPRLIFMAPAYILSVCISLKIGKATYDSIKQKKKTEEFRQANRDILTILPLLLLLWTLGSLAEAFVTNPVFNSLINN